MSCSSACRPIYPLKERFHLEPFRNPAADRRRFQPRRTNPFYRTESTRGEALKRIEAGAAPAVLLQKPFDLFEAQADRVAGDVDEGLRLT
jgi:hypothetical protein